MRVKVIALILLCSTLMYVGAVSSKENKEQIQPNKEYRIVFSIFDNSSAGKYAYLRDSVQAMLASRLAASDKVSVLEKTFSEAELAALKKKGSQKVLSVGGEDADYLVVGALFGLTKGLEIQVDLYPLAAEKETLHFSVLAATPEILITSIDQFSREIAQRAFGDRPAVSGEEKKGGTAQENAGFVTVHPEAAYKRNLYTGTVIGVEGSGITTRSIGARASTKVPGDMTAMAVGDVNGDGNKEILLLSGRNLRLFSKRDNAIVQVAETALPATMDSHALNVADLNGDGKAEIYISATDGLDVSSTIMQWNATAGFQTVARDIRWYLRPLLVPGKGWRLAGQKRGLEKIELIRPGVYLLALDRQFRISEGERLALPERVNLFDFSYADLDGDGFHEMVVVDQKEKLRVYSPSNELMWVSQKNYGGSKIYLGPSQGGATSETNRRNFTPDEDANRDLIFVPGRILVTDIDQNGREEIAIGEAEKARIGNYFLRLRFYDKGAVVGLGWTGSMLTETWRTGNYRGYLADYGFTLLDEIRQKKKAKTEDGRKSIGRLFVGSLPKSGSMADLLPGGAETELAIQDLEFALEKPQDKAKQ